MSLRLILMRHAKSSWSDPGLDDHDRPLNKRGRASARAIGAWLRTKGYLPDLILSSTAQRTRETVERLGLGAPVAWLDGLYHAAPSTMLEILHGKAAGRCVLLCAHNPGCADFAARILARPPGHDRFFDYPTGATLVADLPADAWPDLRFGAGRAIDFVVPRDLME